VGFSGIQRGGIEKYSTGTLSEVTTIHSVGKRKKITIAMTAR
jgi:hypothetical protein